jgi:hypothetical protein
MKNITNPPARSSIPTLAMKNIAKITQNSLTTVAISYSNDEKHR